MTYYNFCYKYIFIGVIKKTGESINNQIIEIKPVPDELLKEKVQIEGIEFVEKTRVARGKYMTEDELKKLSKLQGEFDAIKRTVANYATVENKKIK